MLVVSLFTLANDFFRSNTIFVTAAVFIVSLFLMDYRTVWLSRYDQEKVRLWMIVTTIMVCQIYWVLNFLPNTAAVKALLLVFAYYLFTSLGRAHLDGNLNNIIFRRYIYLSIIVLSSVLLTSTWLI